MNPMNIFSLMVACIKCPICDSPVNMLSPENIEKQTDLNDLPLIHEMCEVCNEPQKDS